MALPHFPSRSLYNVNDTVCKWIFLDLYNNTEIYTKICQELFGKITSEVKCISENVFTFTIEYNSSVLLEFYKDHDTYNHRVYRLLIRHTLSEEDVKKFMKNLDNVIDWDFLKPYLRDDKIKNILDEK